MHPLAYMPAGVLNCRVPETRVLQEIASWLCLPVHIGEQSKAESVVVVVWWVGEAVYYDTVVLSVVHLPHPAVEFVVSDRRPKCGLLILHLTSGVSLENQNLT